MSNQSLPTLESERLILAPVNLGDLEDCLAMDAQPEVPEFFGSGDDGLFDKESHRQFLRERIPRDYGDGL